MEGWFEARLAPLELRREGLAAEMAELEQRRIAAIQVHIQERRERRVLV